MDYISGEWAACLFKGATREPRVVLLLHSANVRVNEVRLLSLGALRHHSSDCLRQRPSVGGYSSQFARTLLRLCFAKLLVLLVGGPDNATACAPYGARPVASGNLTTSSQAHLPMGRDHPQGYTPNEVSREAGSSGLRIPNSKLQLNPNPVNLVNPVKKKTILRYSPRFCTFYTVNDSPPFYTSPPLHG